MTGLSLLLTPYAFATRLGTKPPHCTQASRSHSKMNFSGSGTSVTYTSVAVISENKLGKSQHNQEVQVNVQGSTPAWRGEPSWPMVLVPKTSVPARVPGVRIPPSPFLMEAITVKACQYVSF